MARSFLMNAEGPSATRVETLSDKIGFVLPKILRAR
jgi:hypothetical protein